MFALEMWQRLHHGAMHSDVAKAYSSLGEVFRTRGDERLEEACENLEKSLTMYKKLYIMDNHDVMNTLASLADVYIAKKDADTAGPLLERAEQMQARLTHAATPNLIVSEKLNRIRARMCELQGDAKMGEYLYVPTHVRLLACWGIAFKLMVNAALLLLLPVTVCVQHERGEQEPRAA